MTNTIPVTADTQVLLNLLSEKSIPSFLLVIDQDDQPVELRLADRDEITALLAAIQQQAAGE